MGHRRVLRLVQHPDDLRQTARLPMPTIADLRQQNDDGVTSPFAHDLWHDKTVQQLVHASQQLQVHGWHQLQRDVRYGNFPRHLRNRMRDQYAQTPTQHSPVRVVLNGGQDFRQTHCAQGALETFRQGQKK